MKKVGIVLLGICLIFIGVFMGFICAAVAVEEACQEGMSLYHGHGTKEQ